MFYLSSSFYSLEFNRFQNSKEEITKGYDVVPQLSDDIQLTVDEYRKKLYEVILILKINSYFFEL
jgi:hypothetical protein